MDLAAGACLPASLALFLVGLLSPLTPSEGNPSLIALLSFLLLPMALLLVFAWRVRNSVVRLFAVLGAVAMPLFIVWLLFPQRPGPSSNQSLERTRWASSIRFAGQQFWRAAQLRIR